MLIYRLLSFLAPFVLKLLSLFSPGLKRTLDARKDCLVDAKSLGKQLDRPLIFHCASLGEFDQALPLIQLTQHTFPGKDILVSFFSPSGYEKVKEKFPELRILYLPLDSPGNMTKWVSYLEPSAVFFARYEFWPNLLFTLQMHGVPYIIFSAVFRPGTAIFNPLLGFLRRLVLSAKVIFVQDKASEKLLSKYSGVKAIKAGDTRVDRVWGNIRKGCADPVLLKWGKGDRILILGSVHKEDLLVVMPCLEWAEKNKWQVLIAPHHVDEASIHWWLDKTQAFDPAGWSEGKAEGSVLILDTIGLLANAYAIGDAAYIGGGFGKSIHNTLEPAAAGIPISFGPRHERFVEAGILIESGAAFPVENAFDVKTWLDQIKNDDERGLAGQKALRFIEEQRGAAQQIITYLASESIFE